MQHVQSGSDEESERENGDKARGGFCQQGPFNRARAHKARVHTRAGMYF